MVQFNDKKNIAGFVNFLHKDVLGKELSLLLDEYTQKSDVYVFSGIIRDFLLKRKKTRVRDVDLVVTAIPDVDALSKIWKKYKGQRNSFGGAKFQYENISVDVWEMGKTWGIVEKKEVPSVDALINSSFFNCTAIVFNVKEKVFVYNNHFSDFIENRILDIVYEKNPNQALCVVNSFLYMKKYDVTLSDRLKQWIRVVSQNINDYEKAQETHYHKIIYSNKKIEKLIKQL